ncbi:hypothetical protein CsSME_00033343 [Camellia sinensis var. sinensis]
MLAKESAGPNFDLPEEVLEVLPSDPFEQLDVARKITSIALSTRVSSLESERSVLRAQLTDKDNLIADLQSQIDSLDSSLSDAADKLARADHEKESLLRENAALSNTVRKLNRDVSKKMMLHCHLQVLPHYAVSCQKWVIRIQRITSQMAQDLVYHKACC